MSDPLFPATIALVSTLSCMRERIDKAKSEEEIWSFGHETHALLENMLDDDWDDNSPLIEQLQFKPTDKVGFDLAIEYAMHEGEDLYQECRVDVRYQPAALTVSTTEGTSTGTEVIYDIMTVISLLCMASSDGLVVTNGKKERMVRERRAAMRLVTATGTA